MVDDDRQVGLPLADRDLVNPDPAQPPSRSRWARASSLTRAQIQPTVRHVVPHQRRHGLADVLTASHAH